MRRYWWILALLLVCAAGCGTSTNPATVAEDAAEALVEAAVEYIDPIVLEVSGKMPSHATGREMRAGCGVREYWGYPEDVTWVKINFDGWESPPPKHAAEERILLRGPEGNPNVILMSYNDGEYESAYIAVEDVEAVVRRVMIEEDVLRRTKGFTYTVAPAAP